jgi:hypothetical protein
VKSFVSASSNALRPTPENFSPVLGGPLFQLFLRVHLSDDALRLVRKRALVIALFAWLPLLLLSTLEHHLFAGSAAVPFVLDLEVHVRFLVALPLLIGGELLVHLRIRTVVRQFLATQLIPDNAMARFDAAIASSSAVRRPMSR